ncbi:MAG: alanine--tRNA ligase [Gaiellales bacterium]
MDSHEIRRRFLEYFTSRGHMQVPSGSLVPPAWDTSVLITTAGMQPLKQYFLGLEPPPAPRLASVQKCFRTVDIDEVGRTARHLTFFEMLGNFSLGDYFKRDAVQWAFDLATSADGFGLDPDRIWTTVYRGDERVEPDEEAIALWREVGVPAERIVRLGSDNFWQAGPVGPCGPSSELFMDRGAQLGCGRPDCAPGCDCDRFLEFWNLVFMQYNMLEGGGLEPLPRPSIDTGCGVERLGAVVQGVDSVFETDVFAGIIQSLCEWGGAEFGPDPAVTKSLKVIADHGRGMSFLATDGVEPDREGRGYVLRRVIRRAVLHGSRVGLDEPFLSRLHERVVELMGDAHPELRRDAAKVSEVLAAEEQRFEATLETGGRMLDELLAKGGDVSAADAFMLHDTYGFPFELTAEIAAERGRSVDESGFAELMEQQRERARADTRGKGTEDAGVFAREAGFTSEFVGYEALDVTTHIGALRQAGDGTLLVKLRESPFYAKGGGQVADTGWLESETGRAAVEDVVRLDDDQVLVARLERGELHPGDPVRARVDAARRRPTMANHTATHLLHRALRGVLGEHVTQAGSYVGPDKLRFDFRHGSPLTPEELARVEQLVNDDVVANHPLRTFTTTQDHARELGAMMLFGEKYGEHVRVVEIADVSRELCGGTHVRSTAEVGPFVVTRESSSSQGVRRIEAISSGLGLEHLRQRSREADRLAAQLAERDAELRRLRSRGGSGGSANGADAALAESAVEAAGVRVVAAAIEGVDSDALLQTSDRLKARLAPAVVVLGSAADGKVHLVANFDPQVVERGLSAVDVIREVAPLVGGGGGGRPTMARAGGSQPDGLDQALAHAKALVLEKLGSAA